MWLKNAPVKRALIVVAHDDDAALFSGTVSQLARQGWELGFLCFYTDKYRPEEVPVRKQEMASVADLLGFSYMDLVDFTLRHGLDTIAQPWMPVPYESFSREMDLDALDGYIEKAIRAFRPAVIFSLDDVIGGYGHPEHVAVSQSVVRVSNVLSRDNDLPLRRIYQNVWPASQSAAIMGTGGPYAAGKEVYGCDGMPEPDVEIDISGSGGDKMAVLKAHASQHRNLKKFLPSYHFYPGWLYFRIFNREHFRVLETGNSQTRTAAKQSFRFFSQARAGSFRQSSYDVPTHLNEITVGLKKPSRQAHAVNVR